MNKFLYSIFIGLLLVLMSGGCYADEVKQNTKENVAFILFDNSKVGQKDVKKINYDPLITILSSKFNVLEDSNYNYNSRLMTKGLNDIAFIEKNDLLEVFKTDGLDYIVLIQINPCKYESFNINIEANMKIVNVKQGSYIYNGRIFQNTTWGSRYAVLKKISKESAEIIQTKLVNQLQ